MMSPCSQECSTVSRLFFHGAPQPEEGRGAPERNCQRVDSKLPKGEGRSRLVLRGELAPGAGLARAQSAKESFGAAIGWRKNRA